MFFKRSSKRKNSKKARANSAVAKKGVAKVNSSEKKLDVVINLLSDEKEDVKSAKADLRTDDEKKDDRFKLMVENLRKIDVTKKSSTAWLERVNRVQQKRITPEMRRRIQRRAMTQQRTMLNARRCKRMQHKTRSNMNIWANTMQLMENSSVRTQENVSRNAISDMLSLQSRVDEHANDFLNIESGRASVRHDQLEVSRAVVLADSLAEQADEAATVCANEIERLLAQLRTEPNTDAERKAKFSLYETYLETVCEIRKQTFDFWADCKPDFEKEARQLRCAAVNSIEKSLKDLDSERALGMPEFSRRIWFVYGMCQKAIANNEAIQAVLKMIRIKLELLSHQGECPICLDEFDNKHVPQLLACCHKVCDVCWEHWKALRRGRVFCPLCRNDEFVEDVLNMHSNSNLQ